jgi:SulP family sulfate permease
VAAVLGIGMLIGIVVGVVLSLLAVALRTAQPLSAELGLIPGTDTFRVFVDDDDAVIIPGLLIYRFDAPVFFANAALLHDDILRRIQRATAPVERVVLDCESIHDIDSTGAQQLLELFDELEAAGVSIVLARVRTELLDDLGAIDAPSHLAGVGIHLEIDDAVAEFLDEPTD